MNQSQPAPPQTRSNSLPTCPLTLTCAKVFNRGTGFVPSTLGAARFSEVGQPCDDPRLIPVRLTGVERTPQFEIWSSSLPVRVDTREGIRYAENGVLLLGWLHVGEPQLDDDLEEATCRAYNSVLRLMYQRRFPHWIRAWNFLSAINEGRGHRERYRRFNVGRHRALGRTAGFERALPAATTIGTRPDRGLTLYFLASRVHGIQIENPRQLSAFRYPRLYGPQSPSFSRSVLQHWSDRSLLFISGTASITGHATQHADDAVGQFEEVLRNVQALLDHAALTHCIHQRTHAWRPVSFKLYVRDEEVLRSLGTRSHFSLASRAPTVVLFGEFCRADLLVELEAVYEWSHTHEQGPRMGFELS